MSFGQMTLSSKWPSAKRHSAKLRPAKWPGTSVGFIGRIPDEISQAALREITEGISVRYAWKILKEFLEEFWRNSWKNVKINPRRSSWSNPQAKLKEIWRYQKFHQELFLLKQNLQQFLWELLLKNSSIKFSLLHKSDFRIFSKVLLGGHQKLSKQSHITFYA